MKKRYDIETLPIGRVLNKEYFYANENTFMKKSCRNLYQKLFADPFLILVNNTKQPLHAKKIF